jgi:superfamily II DNA or RNA helicase
MGKYKYPDIDDINFYDKINKIYSEYKIPKKKGSINSFCNRKGKEFKLQQPQEFVSKYINPKTPYKSLLVYHRIGAGKTCASIQIAEQWRNKRKIVYVLPASLKGNFRNELRSPCGNNNYITESELNKLKKYKPTSKEYKDIIAKSDKRIDEYYNIYSYNKFIQLIQNGKISLKNSILIIDEIQNMVSETGMYYTELSKLLKKSSKDLRIVLLSATPMFDKPIEIALTMNLLNPSPNIPTGKQFEDTFIKERKVGRKTFYNVKNMNLFKKMIKGYVSFYKGAPSYTFPEMKIKYLECEMSDFQYRAYIDVLNKEDLGDLGDLNRMTTKQNVINVSDLTTDFYNGPRFVSNIVYPNKKLGKEGLVSLTKSKIDNLYKYSCKLDRMMRSIRRARGKIFIYSGSAGLKTIAHILEVLGYKDYRKSGIGKKRYAVWSGDQSIKSKDDIRNIYNSPSNLYGNELKIILGSPSIKEGVTLKAVRYVHVLEPYWNQSRLEQVVGRASRFCSHIGLPEDERNVKVYVYIAYHPDEKMTIDQYIKKLSLSKQKIIKEFEKAIKEASVDCRLNLHANQDDGSVIVCE